MVTRKPVPSAAGNLAPNPSAAPYPTTPIAPEDPRDFRMQDAENRLRSPGSEPDTESAWAEEGLQRNKQLDQSTLPESLRVGPRGYTPNSSQEKLKANGSSTNPFLQKQKTGSSIGSESSANVWGASDKPRQPSGASPSPPHQILNDLQPPAQQLANISVSDRNTNPWQPALNEKLPPLIPSIPSIQREDSGNKAWSTPSAPPATDASQQPVLLDMDEPESPAWDEDEPSPVHELPANNIPEDQQINEDRHAWDENQGHPLTQHPPQPLLPHQDTQHAEGWNLIDHEPASSGPQQSGIVADNGTVLERFPTEEQPPALPPRRSQEEPPAQPPRPTISTDAPSSSSSILSPTPTARKQKKETYEIKKISWHDVNAAENPRVSPILVQNANGPCPLLALVNALTLSTPANVDTALVETLRSREQVSLGLLLDAVFDELMSGRRGDAAQELPDVTELYSFLLTLHTGMNVNPRFFPPPPRSPNDPRKSMSHVHPSDREASIPGTFEETSEMKLYSTFSIPLIHGWLPGKDSLAHAALSRTAQSYEDAQNIMFHEEELEDKLQREGLSFQEQATLEDIATIKAFFASNATQLTPNGLQTITTSLAPGAVAILFRNDHFSTLYRHPATLQLLQLVTDMGYAGHEEVVWESLTDINGENAEFFSGDFRLVGGALTSTSTASQQAQNLGDGWTTVPIRRTDDSNTQHEGPSISHDDVPRSPITEQEDHDLALALQLQEEEEERHRAEIARRRRETELSQQYIEQQSSASIPVSQRGGGRGRGSSVPSRGGGRGGSSEMRPAIPPRRNNANSSSVVQAAAAVPASQPQPQVQGVADPEAGSDAPPPSYEHAATQAAYMPPTGHPSHPGASPNQATGGRRASGASAVQGGGAGSGRGRRGTLVNQMPTGSAAGRPRLGPTRHTAGLGAGQAVGLDSAGRGRDKDCVVM